jgi:Domain of unknown function (DUF3336)
MLQSLMTIYVSKIGRKWTKILTMIGGLCERYRIAHCSPLFGSDQLNCLKVNRSLRMLREKNDARGVLGVLETCVRTNFAGVESPR